MFKILLVTVLAISIIYITRCVCIDRFSVSKAFDGLKRKTSHWIDGRRNRKRGLLPLCTSPGVDCVELPSGMSEEYIIDGSKRTEANGRYKRVDWTCNEHHPEGVRPVYQNEDTGYVLHQPTDCSPECSFYLGWPLTVNWIVNRGKDFIDAPCGNSGFIESVDTPSASTIEKTACPDSPDGSGCVGLWNENGTEQPDGDRCDGWCKAPDLTVQASRGYGEGQAPAANRRAVVWNDDHLTPLRETNCSGDPCCECHDACDPGGTDGTNECHESCDSTACVPR